MVPIFHIRKLRLPLADWTKVSPQRLRTDSSLHVTRSDSQAQWLSEQNTPCLGAGFGPGFEVKPKSVPGAASWDLFYHRGPLSLLIPKFTQ